MILCWSNTLYILSKIKFIIKINFSGFFFYFLKKYMLLLENLKLSMWFLLYFHWTLLL